MVVIPHVLIMAAGQGKRMHSKVPKVLHPVLFRPMIHYVLDLARAHSHASISMVVGHGEEAVREACRSYDGLNFFKQKEQRGTAHAVKTAESFLGGLDGHLVILSGDVILLREETLGKLLESHAESRSACTVVTAKLADPNGYGRVLRKDNGHAVGIREEKD